jgi:hypothetical protein
MSGIVVGKRVGDGAGFSLAVCCDGQTREAACAFRPAASQQGRSPQPAFLHYGLSVGWSSCCRARDVDWFSSG